MTDGLLHQYIDNQWRVLLRVRRVLCGDIERVRRVLLILVNKSIKTVYLVILRQSSGNMKGRRSQMERIMSAERTACATLLLSICNATHYC